MEKYNLYQYDDDNSLSYSAPSFSEVLSKLRMDCNPATEWLTVNLHESQLRQVHFSDVIISAMASQTTGVSTVCSAFCSGADQRKHQSFAFTGLCEGNPPVTGGVPSQIAINVTKMCVRVWCHYWQIFDTRPSHQLKLYKSCQAVRCIC